jgi:peptidoglycan/LPS O-acetylase OafA/YrhL
VRYSPQLDGLRAIAICAVLAQHLFESHFRGAWVGVDIFFVLSGFLITSILIAERESTGTFSFKNFYGRRALRLLPALLVLVIATGALTMAGLTTFKTPNAFAEAAAPALFYFSNFTTTDMGVLLHTWSLSVEEQFYFIWPIVLTGLVLKLKPTKQIALLLALIAAFTATRLYFESRHYNWWQLYTWFFTRADELIFGALIACATAEWPGNIPSTLRKLKPLTFAGIAFVTYIFCTADNKQRWLYQWGLTAIAISCGLIVFTVQFEPKSLLSRFLKTKPLVWLGKRSYGMYVYHFPIIWIISHHIQFPAGKIGILIATATKVAVTIAVSWISYRWIESPALALKDKLFSSKTPSLSQRPSRAPTLAPQ